MDKPARTEPPPPELVREGISANFQAVAYVAFGGFLLIVMASLVKHLGESLPALQILFVRSLAGLVVILPVAWRVRSGILKTNRFGLHTIRGLVGFIGNVCFFYALINLAIADTVTIQFSRPLIMVVAAALFLGEVVGARRAIATAIGFAGIMMITRPFGEGFDPWVLSAIGGAVFGTLVVVAVKFLSRTESTVVIMFYYALFTTLFSLIPALFIWQAPSPAQWALLALTGTLSIVGQGMFTHGIGLGETSFVMPFDYLRIVYSFILGMVWFAEVPGIWSFAGATVIVGASLYLLRIEHRKST
jgi:drug/metabolite transporter (DMT)-like permease